MDIKIRCPHCETKLVVGDELVGQAVLCEDCNKQFTVEQPAGSSGKSSSGERPRDRGERDDRGEERPRSRRRDDDDHGRSRDDFDDEDDRPIRRKPKRSSSHVAPLIFGSLLILMTLGVGVGMYFTFGFGTSSSRDGFGVPNNRGGMVGVPAVGGSRYRLSDAQWIAGNTFAVTVATENGRTDPTLVRLVYRSLDGTGNYAFSMPLGPRQPITVPKIGGGRTPTTMWVEPITGGAPLSNMITLN
ncbi:zinc ribbon domain-containing protein [Limnoglobus roseus]|uniref:Zinc finger/thioredoxin putative domain-containing protein n=1 Tax=Limnoglobus roseus TaxID=2598579 RepID=A0A5C1A8F4_9BACT|nr:hypothetical protein [Limnoglobus roseus]QEL14547.1 hypothetical protein PX52LOC_01437 [Limnoglobus roseus]